MTLTFILTAGLLLIAETAPEAPSAPPGFPEPRNGPLMSGAAAQHNISPVQNRASSSTGQTTSYQNQQTYLKGQPAVNRPVLTGKEEISLGFRVNCVICNLLNLVINFLRPVTVQI